ncbi:MAG: cell division protein FtsA [Bdellovibrio sp.]|nr:cell division protein FtsA [Bdellovibrio sp.]
MSKKDVVAGIDIGTTKICCAIGRLVDESAEPKVEMIGFSRGPSPGLKKRKFVNVEATLEGVHKAIQEAELMAGVRISEVFTGTAGEQLRSLGFSIAGICPEPLAAAEAVLSDDEKRRGVALVDLGGGSCDIGVFKEGQLLHSVSLPFGGTHVTNDIAVGLRVAPKEAEVLKIQHGYCISSLVKADETIEVQGVIDGPRILSKRFLAEIIEPRVEEMLLIIKQEIFKLGQQELLAAGIVITGGATLLRGMPELAKYIFDLPVRRGFPSEIGGLKDVVNSPKYAAGVGLLKYGAKTIAKTRFPIREQNIYDKMRGSMTTWIRDLF